MSSARPTPEMTITHINALVAVLDNLEQFITVHLIQVTRVAELLFYCRILLYSKKEDVCKKSGAQYIKYDIRVLAEPKTCFYNSANTLL